MLRMYILDNYVVNPPSRSKRVHKGHQGSATSVSHEKFHERQAQNIGLNMVLPTIGRNCCERRTLLLVLVLLGLVLKCQCRDPDSFVFDPVPIGQDVLDGRRALMSCGVVDPVGLQFHWELDGRRLANTTRRGMVGSNLQFDPVDKDEDQGEFRCVASNVTSGYTKSSDPASFNIRWLDDTGRVRLENPSAENLLQAGIPITLRCRIMGSPTPTYAWFRNGEEMDTGADPRLTAARDGRLTIDSISPDDNGVYSCRAENRAGQAVSNEGFNLELLDESIPRLVVGPQDVVVNKNDDARLDCVFTADPPPTIQWYFNNEGPLTNMSRIYQGWNGSLIIRRVKKKDEGQYDCVATGSNGRGTPVVAQATIRLAYLGHLNSLDPYMVPAGDNLIARCVPPDGLPEPLITWERDGAPVPSSGRVYTTGEQLIINRTQVSDMGNFTCVASNTAGEERQNMMVVVATPPQWLQRPEDTDADEDGHAYLHCHTRATPNPSISWHRTSLRIDPAKDNRYEVFSNGTLHISPVRVLDEGDYYCASQTLAGSIEGQLFLNVIEKLKFSPSPVPRTLELGDTVAIRCNAKGEYPPTIQWLKHNVASSAWPAYVQEANGTLQFNGVQKEDAGLYTCIASSPQQGLINATIKLTVFVKPHFTVTPNDTTVGEGSQVLLHCQAEGDPEPIITWTGTDSKVYTEKSCEEEGTRFCVLPNGTLRIVKAEPEDQGKYTCIAGNVGWLTREEVNVVINNGAVSGVGADPAMLKTIGIACGCAAAYIILVLGLMFYCRRRKPSDKYEEEEGTKEEADKLNGAVAKEENGIHYADTMLKVDNAIPLNMVNSSYGKRRGSYDKLQFPRHDLQSLGLLGRGEFGEVFLAKAQGIRDGEEETIVVVKSLSTRDENLQFDFRREMDMLSKMNHDNVVRLLGVCKEAEPVCLITEYMEWGDLKQFLMATRHENGKKKASLPPLSLIQKIHIANQIVLGMEHLSNHRFIHKDLAGRNCLLNPHLDIKISTLSLSRDVYATEYYHYHQQYIPLRWMPAEAVFEDDWSTKSDVYAFGITMWEIFNLGCLPFKELDDEDVMKGLTLGELEPEVPPYCPKEVFAVMQKCWAESPKDRPTFSDLAVALSELEVDSDV
ncbi:PREDICTED: inactive tyrosine-protein kinase 7-like [Branchiostoma belcheri]|uniref:Inactive tyrosine-protein kinase 7-like n=1 Tax=Branchiostoma belcheri TaxID=7741 RepID=A0A6P4ZME6_BRABE|nr:PREDICTED: inactive tyrosine-protein kinase 7-like [Branchiostoma belcheri]